MSMVDYLTIAVAILMFAILILIFIYWSMARKEKMGNTQGKDKKNEKREE